MTTDDNPFQPGRPIELFIESPEADELWATEIVLVDGDRFRLSWPLMDEVPVLILEPVDLTCRVMQDGVLWSYPARLTAGSDAWCSVPVPTPAGLTREQQRNHVRIALVMETTLIADHTPDVPLEVTIRDLSGGGCQFSSRLPVFPGSEARLTIPLPGQPLEVGGRVVRVDEQPSAPEPYTGGFAFTEIPEAERERLIKYIFEVMRERRKQGKPV